MQIPLQSVQLHRWEASFAFCFCTCIPGPRAYSTTPFSRFSHSLQNIPPAWDGANVSRHEVQKHVTQFGYEQPECGGDKADELIAAQRFIT
jgi:hypothetical protein